MKIVSHFEPGELAGKSSEIVPGIEWLHLAPDAPVPPDLQADILLTSVLGGANLEQLLAPLHGIQWVHVHGTGVDQFPVQLVQRALLTCSRGASAVAIAEWAMAMMLAAAKNLPENWLRQTPEHWYFAQTAPLRGATLGLLGYGAIGQEVARRARAFDMEILALVRRPRSAESGNGVTFVADLETLMARSDHLVVAAPATPQTRHLVNRQSLAAARPGLHLVNIARGSLVDQEALQEALDGGQLALASLDVVAPEPLPAGHWLYQHPKVRLSPHISWHSPDAFDNMESLFLQNLARFIEGRPLSGTVDIQHGY